MSRPGRSSRRGRPGELLGAVLAAPPALWLGVFFLTPVALVAVCSIGTSTFDLGAPVDYSSPTLANFTTAFSDTFRIVFVNTLQISVVGTALCLAIAVPTAYWIAVRLSGWAQVLALALVVVPFYTSFLLRTISWRVLLADSGPLVTLLGPLAPDGGLGILDTLAGVQLGVVYNYLPLAVIPLFVAFDRLDPVLRHAAADLGASGARRFLQVTLPGAKAGIISAALLVFIPLTGDYVTASVLGGARGQMVGSLIAASFLDSQDWALGAASAVLLVAAVTGIIALGAALVGALAVLWRRLRPLDLLWGVAARASARAPHRRPGSGPRTSGPRPGGPAGATGPPRRVLRPRATGGAFLAAVVVFLWAPLLTVLVYSFNRGDSLASWEGFGARWYQQMADNEAITSSLVVSVKVAALSTAVGVLLGTCAGLLLARARGRARRPMLVVLVVALISPEIVTAIGLLLVFVNAAGLAADGTVRLVIAHSVLALPLVAFVVRARMVQADPRLDDAAGDLGASPWRALRQVTVPLAVPAVAGGALLAFTLSLDDYVASSLLSTVGTTPFPIVVYSTLRTGLQGDVAAAAVLVLVSSVSALALALRVLTRRRGAAEVKALLSS